jgi:CubicO group peptidase (beta-lactamase class C family)
MKSRFIRKTATLAALALSALALARAVQAAPAPKPAAPADAIDALVKRSYLATSPGAAIIAVRDGKVIYRKAIGMADLELDVPLSPDSVFRLGSVTKQFTAVAILMLAEEGKLSLSDPITKFLPDYPTQGHVITVEHLLTHTSGIQSYTAMPGWMVTKIQADMSLAELIDGFKKEPMEFAPGTRWSYDNSGYILLGAIIEKASGTPYATFLKRRIFAPLGMRSTNYGSNEEIIPRRVRGYSRGAEGDANARYLSMTQPYAAGALVSTVDDLAAWDAALYTEKLVKQASLEKAWTPYVLADGKATTYGYGWSVSSLRGRPTVEHGGGIFGFSTYVLRVPKERVFVAVLCNRDSPKTDPGIVARKTAALVLGDPFPENVAVAVAPEVLARYAGVYEIDKDSRRTVIVEGDKIFTQRTGGARAEAKPRSETEFFYENSITTFRFVTAPDGRVIEMLMYANGADEPERAARVADAPAAPKEARVDPALYDSYAGRYDLAPGFVLTVTREGESLMVQATGQQRFEIFPTSETEFFYKVVDARITFVKGPDGQVDVIVLHQGGRDMPAKRKK